MDLFNPVKLHAVLISDRLVLATLAHSRHHLDAAYRSRLLDEIAHAAVELGSKGAIFEVISIGAQQVRIELGNLLTQELIVVVRVVRIQILDM